MATTFRKLSYPEIETLASDVLLSVFGAFHPEPSDLAPANTKTLIMFGPDEPAFWPAFQKSPEYIGGDTDPMDRWSERVLGGLAKELGGKPIFPFGGPPYAPFIAWAQRTGRAWPSPVGLLVHDRAGLFVSYRGAIALDWALDIPPAPQSPCTACATRDCLTACPVGAMGAGGYDVGACHTYLDTDAGGACLSGGCQVRVSCPVSKNWGRNPAQSAFHMKAFHK